MPSCEIIMDQIQNNDIDLTNYKFIKICERKEYMFVAFLYPEFKGNFETLCLLCEAIDHQEDVLIKKM